MLAFHPRAGAPFTVSGSRKELLIEWPKGEVEPTRNWFSTLPQDSTLKQLVATTKVCWMIEHDYLELESELGLDHFEACGWRGFHHHEPASLSAIWEPAIRHQHCRDSAVTRHRTPTKPML